MVIIMENKIILLVISLVVFIEFSVTSENPISHTSARQDYRELDSCDVNTYLLVQDAIEVNLSKCEFNKYRNDSFKIFVRFRANESLVFYTVNIWSQLKDSSFNNEIKKYILERYDSCTVFEADEYGVPRVFVVPIKVSKGEVTFM
jgi:hypothetical protein